MQTKPVRGAIMVGTILSFAVSAFAHDSWMTATVEEGGNRVAVRLIFATGEEFPRSESKNDNTPIAD